MDVEIVTNDEGRSVKSPLIKSTFVTLAYHAKMHKLLDTFARASTPEEKEAIVEYAVHETRARFERELDTVIEKIDKKELALADTSGSDSIDKGLEFEKLKRAAFALRNELKKGSAEEENQAKK